ncbi:D-amino acid aminotransferase [Aliidiomarina halalkaliphila]|uniref:Aminodeoxychorismate lyase n=1 Tax=Aliidiomarina halalkaliphila TaxID=2593535 RepID=A0A552X3F0_9GAMM|nr:D-amino acid aminotransferase [Aliidiomarina halalkaliphila]TRW49409.1 D-amino acid aminotransferase [Aliidiomarina halalkaliphila]
MNKLWLNGHVVPADQAKISVFDRGFLFGDGIYEVVPIYAGQPFLFDEHMARLERSLHAVSIPMPIPRAEWLQVIDALSDNIPEGSGVLYIHITRGEEFPRSHLPANDLTPTVFATLSPFTPPSGEPTPVRVSLLEDNRWLRCDIKSISLLGNIMGKLAAAQDGTAEPLMHRAGRITEGATCNYFIVKNNTLITAPADTLILAGITRDWILTLARDNGISVEERAFSIAELYDADECFLASSTREILPVAMVSEQTIGSGETGPITQQLIQYFRQSRPQATHPKVVHENQI